MATWRCWQRMAAALRCRLVLPIHLARRYGTTAIRRFRARRCGRWSTDQLGRRGERLAERRLRRSGYRVVGRRVQLPSGEIDLIAVAPGRRVVFVEVKTRRGDLFTRPGMAVDQQKRARLRRLAGEFIRRHRLQGCGIRFDVVTVVWPRDGSAPRVVHYPAAFDAAGEPSLPPSRRPRRH